METMKLSDFRKAMKFFGYTVKAKRVSFEDLARDSKVFVDVFDGKMLINKSIMSSGHLEKYASVFNVLNNNKIV